MCVFSLIQLRFSKPIVDLASVNCARAEESVVQQTHAQTKKWRSASDLAWLRWLVGWLVGWLAIVEPGMAVAFQLKVKKSTDE